MPTGGVGGYVRKGVDDLRDETAMMSFGRPPSGSRAHAPAEEGACIEVDERALIPVPPMSMPMAVVDEVIPVMLAKRARRAPGDRA